MNIEEILDVMDELLDRSWSLPLSEINKPKGLYRTGQKFYRMPKKKRNKPSGKPKNGPGFW